MKDVSQTHLGSSEPHAEVTSATVATSTAQKSVNDVRGKDELDVHVTNDAVIDLERQEAATALVTVDEVSLPNRPSEETAEVAAAPAEQPSHAPGLSMATTLTTPSTVRVLSTASFVFDVDAEEVIAANAVAAALKASNSGAGTNDAPAGGETPATQSSALGDGENGRTHAGAKAADADATVPDVAAAAEPHAALSVADPAPLQPQLHQPIDGSSAVIVDLGSAVGSTTFAVALLETNAINHNKTISPRAEVVKTVDTGFTTAVLPQPAFTQAQPDPAVHFSSDADTGAGAALAASAGSTAATPLQPVSVTAPPAPPPAASSPSSSRRLTRANTNTSGVSNSSSSNVSPRLLEPTKSWQAKTGGAASSSDGAAASSSPRQQQPLQAGVSTPAKQPTTPRAPVLATGTRSRSATRIAAQPPQSPTAASGHTAGGHAVSRVFDYSHVASRLHTHPTAAQAPVVAPPQLPPSRYTPGGGHSRDWVSVVDVSTMAKLPETSSAYKYPLAPFAASAGVGGAGGGAAGQARGRSGSVASTRSLGSAAITPVMTDAPVASPTPLGLHAPSATSKSAAQARLPFQGTTMHPMRRSSKAKEADDEAELRLAKRMGLIVGARPRSSSVAVRRPPYDATAAADGDSGSADGNKSGTAANARDVEFQESADEIRSRAADRLYSRALESIDRQARRAASVPPECTFRPALTQLAHDLGSRIPYLSSNTAHGRRNRANSGVGDAAFGFGQSGASSPEHSGTAATDAIDNNNNMPASPSSTLSVVQLRAGQGRHEALYASAAVQAQKKQEQALKAYVHNPELSFSPAITDKARRMTAEARAKTLQRSLPPSRRTSLQQGNGGVNGDNQQLQLRQLDVDQRSTVSAGLVDAGTTSALPDRLFAYSRVFEERRAARAEEHFKSIAPLQPALNPRSLAMVSKPRSSSAFNRRPVHEVAPETTSAALAARKREMELARCTFTPSTTDSKASNSSTKNAKSGGGVRGRMRSASVDVSGGGGRTGLGRNTLSTVDSESAEPVHERLIRLGSQTLSKLAAAREMEKGKELLGATFTPAINRGIGVGGGHPSFEPGSGSTGGAAAATGGGASGSGSRARAQSATPDRRQNQASAGGHARHGRGGSGSSSNAFYTIEREKGDIADRLYSEAQEIAARLEAKRAELAKMKQATYSFAPHLSPMTKRLAEGSTARRSRLSAAAGSGLDLAATAAAALVAAKASSGVGANDADGAHASSAASPAHKQQGEVVAPQLTSADKLLLDKLFETARDFEHARARALQTVVKRQMNDLQGHKPRHSAAQRNKAIRDAADAVLDIIGAGRPSYSDGSATFVAAAPASGSAGSGTSTAGVPSISSRRSWLWDCLYDAACTDEQIVLLCRDITRRIELRDTTFQPRGPQHSAGIVTLVAGAGPDGTAGGDQAAAQALALVAATSSAAGPASGDVWTSLAREHKNYALLEEIHRRLELAQCTFEPNTGTYTFRKAIAGSVPPVGLLAKAARAGSNAPAGGRAGVRGRPAASPAPPRSRAASVSQQPPASAPGLAATAAQLISPANNRPRAPSAGPRSSPAATAATPQYQQRKASTTATRSPVIEAAAAQLLSPTVRYVTATDVWDSVVEQVVNEVASQQQAPAAAADAASASKSGTPTSHARITASTPAQVDVAQQTSSSPIAAAAADGEVYDR